MSKRIISDNDLKKRKNIFYLRKTKTLKEIGEIYGISPERVRQLSNLYKVSFDRLDIDKDILTKLYKNQINNLLQLKMLLDRGKLEQILSIDELNIIKNELKRLDINL